MLPFLKNAQDAGSGSTSEPVKRKSDSEEPVDFLETAMKELFDARSDKDRASAFRAAFQLLEQEPHDEVTHNG